MLLILKYRINWKHNSIRQPKDARRDWADIANDAFPKDNAFHYSDETPIVMVEAARDKDIRALIISEGVTRIYDWSFQN